MPRKYTMQDLSGGTVNRTDANLSFQEMYHMTDYSDDEIEQILDLEVGQTVTIGSSRDITVARTE